MADFDRVARNVVCAALPDMIIASTGQRGARDARRRSRDGEGVARRACRIELDRQCLRACRPGVAALRDFRIGRGVEVADQLIDGLSSRSLDLRLLCAGSTGDERPDRTVQGDRVARRGIDGEDDRAAGARGRGHRVSEQARQPEARSTQVERDVELALVGDEAAIGILRVAPASEQRVVPERLGRGEIGRFEIEALIAGERRDPVACLPARLEGGVRAICARLGHG